MTLTPREVQIPCASDGLVADLTLPPGATALILFAHGSGSNRRSSRNRHVAEVLHGGGFATLLVDLLTAAEQRVDDVTREFRFDIPLLTRRLIASVDWAAHHELTAALPIGLYGASTGAAAALAAAAARQSHVAAVVSRGGRPDLAGTDLPHVRCPTLLIVGSEDTGVIELNHHAAAQLRCPHNIVLIPGATHLFEEPGALEQAAEHTLRFFSRHLPT